MGIIAFERKQESYKYDLSELLGVVSNRPVKKEKAYFVHRLYMRCWYKLELKYLINLHN